MPVWQLMLRLRHCGHILIRAITTTCASSEKKGRGGSNMKRTRALGVRSWSQWLESQASGQCLSSRPLVSEWLQLGQTDLMKWLDNLPQIFRLRNDTKQESSWTIIFADDAVICSENNEQSEESQEMETYDGGKRNETLPEKNATRVWMREQRNGTDTKQGAELILSGESKYLWWAAQCNGVRQREV